MTLTLTLRRDNAISCTVWLVQVDGAQRQSVLHGTGIAYPRAMEIAEKLGLPVEEFENKFADDLPEKEGP